MDSIDFRLLVALHQDARQSFLSLGRKVSLSAPAVRERLRRLEERGILQGFWLTPDPALLGREDLLVFFSGEWDHDQALKILKLPDVAWVALKMDGGLTVQAWPREVDQALRSLRDDLGVNPSGQALSERSHFRKDLSLIDWQIIEELFKEPRMPLNDICKRTGLSPKTARKHLELLTEEHFVYITPKLGSLSDSGELIYALVVFGTVLMSDITEIIEDAYLVNSAERPPSKYLLCRSSSLPEVTSKAGQIKRKFRDVESVVLTLNSEQLIATEFIRSLIRDEVARLQKLGDN